MIVAVHLFEVGQQIGEHMCSLGYAPGAQEVAGFLDSLNIHTAADVPYPKQIVPLATIKVVLGGDADIHGVHKSLRQWFWCGVLGELYGAAIESRFARDLEQVPAWARANSESVPRPKTVDEASFVESRLHSMRTRNSAAYKGVYALLMAQGTMDWLMNQPFDKAHFLDMQVDIHHIFPRRGVSRTTSTTSFARASSARPRWRRRQTSDSAVMRRRST